MGLVHRLPGQGSGLLRKAAAAALSLLMVCALAGCVAVGPPPKDTSPGSNASQGSMGSSKSSSFPDSSAGKESQAAPKNREESSESSSLGEGTSSISAVFQKGYSSYGRSTLTPEVQAAYDSLVAGILQHQTEISLSLGDEASLMQALLCVRRDYPVISWIESQYTYQMNANRIIQSITLRYSKTAQEASAEAAAIYESGQELTANIDPSLSDFDKALILYDRLCGAVVYDLNAPNQRELYGALVDRRATCDGYSKAYQYLLSLVGIEALIVYGEAEEPHAWNIVRLNGSYYLTDPTWGDATLNDGRVFLSHEFAFLDDKSFARSHVPYGSEHNYSLPVCSSMSDNYFVQNNTQLDAAELTAFADCLQSALDLALANNYDAVQIRFGTPELSKTCQTRWIDTGEADQIIQKKSSERGKKAIGRSVSNYGDVLTYLIE